MRQIIRSIALFSFFMTTTSSLWALTTPMADWMERVHIGGRGAVRFMDGESNAVLERNSGFNVYQAGLVVDVDLEENWSFWYDLNLIREGQDRSRFREQVYLQKEAVFNQAWLNVRMGRTFTPIGDDYLLWDQVNNWFASPPVSYVWALDEGILAYGDVLPGDKLSYLAAVQNGNTTFSFDDNANKALTFKLTSKPASWLYTSLSYMDLGKQSRNNSTGKGLTEYWLSGFRLSPLGTTSAESGASPATTVDGQTVEGNIGISIQEWAEIILNGGYVFVNDGGGSAFDRRIRYFRTEIIGFLPHVKRKTYLGARYSVIGTFSSTLGYQFAGTEIAINPAFTESNTSPYSAFNYDQRDLYRYSIVLGQDYSERIRLKVEWTWEGTHLIEPAKTPANLDLLGNRNFFIAEIAFRF